MPGPGPREFGPQGKPVKVWPNVKRLLKYMTSKPWILIIVFGLQIISALSSVYATYMLTPIINDGITPLIGQSLATVDLTPLFTMIFKLLAVYVLGALASGCSGVIMTYLSNHTLNRIRNDMFHKMADLPLSYFDSHTHGELMSHYTNDVGAVGMAVSNSITSLMSACLTMVSVLAMMIYISPFMTCTMVGLLIAVVWVTKVISSKSLSNYTAKQEAVAKLNGNIEEMMAGQKVVKVFTREGDVKSEFDEVNEKARKANTRANIIAGMMGPISTNLAYLNYAIMCILGCWFTIKGTISLGSLASYLTYAKQVSNPINQVMQQFNSIMNAVAGAERIFKIIDMTEEVDEGKVTLVHATYDENNNLVESATRTGKWAWKLGENDYRLLKGDVRFEDVTFSYDGKKTVLNNVSFYAKPSQKLAFVGATGAGKTTITNLINRFYDIQEGTITYDGINVKDIEKDSLRRSLSIVLQDTHLFTGTVKENIKYGKLDATDEEVVRAAKLANADEFISMLPEGYDTMLTGDGSNLSQGQRQLLAIARAHIADAPVLILDEATSSIDTRTEALIEQGMDNLMEDRTTFVIAHRLSTVRNSNAIIVLDHGCIIERGDHEELLEQKGQYYKLYTGQFELD